MTSTGLHHVGYWVDDLIVMHDRLAALRPDFHASPSARKSAHTFRGAS